MNRQVKQKQANRSMGEMGLLEHLDELRRRLMVAIIALLIGVLAGMIFATPVLRILIAPLDDLVPIALSPTESVHSLNSRASLTEDLSSSSVESSAHLATAISLTSSGRLPR